MKKTSLKMSKDVVELRKSWLVFGELSTTQTKYIFLSGEREGI